MHPRYKEHPILLCTEVVMVSSENHKENVNTENCQREEFFIVKAGNGYSICCVLLVTVYVVCYWLQYMLCYWLSMGYWKGYERCVEKNWQEELRG